MNDASVPCQGKQLIEEFGIKKPSLNHVVVCVGLI